MKNNREESNLIVRVYDKEGKPIKNMLEWEELLRDFNYKRIALTNLPWGGKVSTVWLGLDHNWRLTGPPIIFETMVFDEDGKGNDLDMDRYSTLEEAIKGHEEMVKKWQVKHE